MEDLKTLAEKLKSLGEAELTKLAGILEADVETDLGITKGGQPVKTDSDPTPCPQGYIRNAQGVCVPDVG